MFEAMKFLGFGFEFDSCVCCGADLNDKLFAFSYDYNGMLCGKCSNKNDYLELSKGEFAILKNISQTELAKISNLKFLSRNDLISVISMLCKDFRLMTDEEIQTIKQFL